MKTNFDIERETREVDFPVYIDYHKENDSDRTDGGSEDSGDLTMEQLRCALEKMTKELNEEKAARSDLQQQCINLAGKLGTAISNRDSATKDLDDVKTELSITKTLLKKKTSELSRYKELFYTKCEEISQAKAECAGLKSNYHSAQVELEDLRKSLMSFQRENQDYEHVEYQNQELLSECDMLKESLNHALRVQTDLEEELDALKENKERDYDDPNRYDDIVAERDQLEHMLQELTQDFERMQDSSAERFSRSRKVQIWMRKSKEQLRVNSAEQFFQINFKQPAHTEFELEHS